MAAQDMPTAWILCLFLALSPIALAAPGHAHDSPGKRAQTPIDHKIPVVSSDGAAAPDESWSLASDDRRSRKFMAVPDRSFQSQDEARSAVSVPNPTQPGIDLSATTEAANQLVLDGRAGASADVGRQPGVAAEERELEAQIIEAAQRFGVEPGLAAAIIAAEDHTTCPAIQGAAISERVKLIGALSDALGSPLRIAGAYFARTLPARDADGAASAAHAAPRKTAGQPLASCQAGPAGAMIFAQPSAETTPARRVLTQPERRQWVDGVMHF